MVVEELVVKVLEEVMVEEEEKMEVDVDVLC